MAERSEARPKRHGETGEWVVAVQHGGKWRNVGDAEVDEELRSTVLDGLRGADAPMSLSEEEVAERTVEVEFDPDGKPRRPRKVRPVGRPWRVDLPSATGPAGGKGDEPASAPEPDEFLNPYAFVRAVRPATGPLVDGPPVGHDRARPGTWSGRIVVDAEAVTPLLFLDAARSRGERVDGKVHRTYGVRRTPDGGPEIPVTSLKGALRAAYEAVTSSRFGVWSSEWDTVLSYREPGRHGRRRPWSTSPRDLAGRGNLLPAGRREDMSPADRVFGWVAARESQAHKGQLRIRSISSAAEDPSTDVEQLAPPVPLAVLGQPKPTQGRFYAAASAKGDPMPDGVDKSELYGPDRGLRGRKFYWHHAGRPGSNSTPSDGEDAPPAYWEDRGPGSSAKPVDGWFNEFRQAGGVRSDQNRSIDSWIRPGATFRAEIDVEGLSAEELGALLWLVQEDGGGMLRVGYGKPLGFGSLRLRLALDETQLWHTRPDSDRTPDLIVDRYMRLATTTPSAESTATVVADLVSWFLSAADKPALQQYRAIVGGRADARVHYPRTRGDGDAPPPPDPEGKNFTWFAENERGSRDHPAPQLGLPDATEDSPTLPYYTARQQRRG